MSDGRAIMTPQKATLDSMHTLSWFVSYRRLSAQFQFPLSPVTLVYLSQWVQQREHLPVRVVEEWEPVKRRAQQRVKVDRYLKRLNKWCGTLKIGEKDTIEQISTEERQ
jgi:hypothetical protein